jgi:hypothetical protein
MSRSRIGLSAAVVVVAALGTSGVVSAQSTPYYITNGDASTMYIVQNGTLQATVSTYHYAYPPAIRSTIILGQRDDAEAREYTLAGVPTGNTWTGSGNFTQILDGTTDGAQHNYGVLCCTATPAVIQTDLHWQNSAVLFDLPGGQDGWGIAYDTRSRHLFVSLDDDSVHEFDLTGTQVSSFTPAAGRLVGLAYEQATDTLWGKLNGGGTLYQYSKTGTLLNTVVVPGFSPGNDYGGEMALSAAEAIPAVSLTGLAVFCLLVALVGAGFLALRL